MIKRNISSWEIILFRAAEKISENLTLKETLVIPFNENPQLTCLVENEQLSHNFLPALIKLSTEYCNREGCISNKICMTNQIKHPFINCV